MSLANIARELGMQAVDPPAASSTDAGLCFVLTRDRLLAFKVLIYSLLATESFIDLPILVISEDPQVFEDPFVSGIADIKRQVTNNEKNAFRSVLGAQSTDSSVLEKILQYSFPKWTIYSDCHIRRLVCIENEIVLTSRIRLDDLPDADLVCCPAFPFKTALAKELSSERLRDAATKHRLVGTDLYYFAHSFLQRRFSIGKTRISGGIQILGSRLLDTNFRDRLLVRATQKDYPGERSVVADFFRENESYSLAFMSPAFDFGVSFLDKLPIAQGLDILQSLSILNFSGPIKPWERPPVASYGIGHAIWWAYALEVQKRSRLFFLEDRDLAVLQGEVKRPG